MDPERWRRIEDVFQRALDVGEEDRSRFLSEACAGDLDLRREVDAWLAAHRIAPQQLASAVGDAVRSLHSAFAPGRRIGPYEVVSLQGEGGMGSVYRAQRVDGAFHKEVAIKMVKRGIDTGTMLRRFQRERRILARLEHPYIARVMDGGSTEDGLPYLVMEYVDGPNILAFVAERSLDLRARLHLFLQMCEAVAYAHDNNVIHRDLKPSNILVDRHGRPRLLDFGIAALIETEPDASVTSTGLAILTPQYASPEHVRGEPVTTASDVYSLGLILYELLTGTVVQRIARASPAAVVKAVCEAEVPALADAARAARESGSTFPVPPELLDASLDALIALALEKDPSRRCPSVQRFADTIGRYLASIPVGATDPRVGREPTSAAFTVSNARRPFGERSVDLDFESIAVLPFKLWGDYGDNAYLGVGIADSLITKLSGLRQVLVRPTSAVRRFTNVDTDPVVAGRELTVAAVLDGHIRSRGTRVRVTAQLVSTRTGAALWADAIDAELSADIFAVEDAIAEQVAAALVPELTGEERGRLRKRYTDNADAYESYLRGRYHWMQRTSEEVRNAITLFRRASEIDPNYALAYSGLADAFAQLGWGRVLAPADAFPNAKAAAIRALELDDSLAEAHTSLAWVRLLYEWSWVEAEGELRRALLLNDRYATAHLWRAVHLMTTGRFAESLAAVDRAQEIDPLSPIINAVAGWPFYFMREYDRAAERYRKALALDPRNFPAHILLGHTYRQSGRSEAAVESYCRALELEESPWTQANLAHAYATAGYTDKARAMLATLGASSRDRYVCPYDIACVHVGLAEHDAAFEWFERAYQQRSCWLIFLSVEPALDSIRTDPRFDALLRRVCPSA